MNANRFSIQEQWLQSHRDISQPFIATLATDSFVKHARFARNLDSPSGTKKMQPTP